MLGFLEGIFSWCLELAILVTEVIGAIILVIAFVHGLTMLLRGVRGCRIALAEGISTALLFLMCGEVLNSILVPSWGQLLVLAGTVVVRAAITFLLKWEVKMEKAEEAEEAGEA